MIASEHGYNDVVELLIGGAKIRDSISLMEPLDAYYESATALSCEVKDLHQSENEIKISQLPVAIDSQDNRGKTALMTASKNGHTAVAELLVEKGAHIDLQDDDGYSALMTACQNEHSQITSYLLDKDADTFLTNNEGKTAFNIALERDNAEQLSLFTKLRSKRHYPGILFSEGTKRETITATETNIDLEEVGISLSIPENSLSSTDTPVKLEVQPCFSGPFVVPEDVEL